MRKTLSFRVDSEANKSFVNQSTADFSSSEAFPENRINMFRAKESTVDIRSSPNTVIRLKESKEDTPFGFIFWGSGQICWA